MDVPALAKPIERQWRALKKFAADLAAELPSLTWRGNRGLKANLAILETWLRAALLALAETVDLPARRAQSQAATPPAPSTKHMQTGRRAGFRVIEPDEFEREAAAENRFDISQVSGARGPGLRQDPRPAYQRRLDAIDTVLSAPERYARRVKHKLEARRKRAPLKRVALTHRSALPDLLAAPRHSDLGRYIWYFDTS